MPQHDTATPEAEFRVDQLSVSVYEDDGQLGIAAAEAAAGVLGRAVAARGRANAIIATGNSQRSFLSALGARTDVDWPAINLFHMDEYLDLEPGHPAGFATYLTKLLIARVPVGRFFPVPGNPADVELACAGYEQLLRAHPADLCVLGIGENGHIAFNEPLVADFNDPVWVRVVELDHRSRRQQVGEGHFASLDTVPRQAVTLTIPALRAATELICVVPEARKAEAVERTLVGPIGPECPATILRRTDNVHLFLDHDSAARAVAARR
jgi:glucosamine-6-phosphate deaminase